MDAKESSVFRPSEASEDHHPHACTYGLVFLTYTVFDEAVGEEGERGEERGATMISPGQFKHWTESRYSIQPDPPHPHSRSTLPAGETRPLERWRHADRRRSWPSSALRAAAAVKVRRD